MAAGLHGEHKHQLEKMKPLHFFLKLRAKLPRMSDEQSQPDGGVLGRRKTATQSRNDLSHLKQTLKTSPNTSNLDLFPCKVVIPPSQNPPNQCNEAR